MEILLNRSASYTGPSQFFLRLQKMILKKWEAL